MTPEQQRAVDQAEIKVRIIDNGLLVRAGRGWLFFKTWEEASAEVGKWLKVVESKRNGQSDRA